MPLLADVEGWLAAPGLGRFFFLLGRGIPRAKPGGFVPVVSGTQAPKSRAPPEGEGEGEGEAFELQVTTLGSQL